MWMLWCGIAVAAFILEIITPGTLVSVWFAIAGLVTAPVSLLTDNVWLQLAVFCGCSLLCLFLFRPTVLTLFRTKTTPTNADRNIGQTTRLELPAIDGRPGRATVGGMEWSVQEIHGRDLPAGTPVVVEAIQGVRLMVRRLPETNGLNDKENNERE